MGKVQDISLDKYKSIVRISEFKANQFCNNDYRVEEVNGLYTDLNIHKLRTQDQFWLMVFLLPFS